MADLEKVRDYLTKYPTTTILLEGHTDNQGERSKNIKLSAQRILALKQYLVSHGIAAERIGSRALGSLLPISPNDSEQTRSFNRCVLVKLVNQ